MTDKANDKRIVMCFMDGIDWQHHLDADADGTKLYPSRRALERCTDHDLNECGIVEVQVRLMKWVVPQNLKFHKHPDDSESE